MCGGPACASVKDSSSRYQTLEVTRADTTKPFSQFESVVFPISLVSCSSFGRSRFANGSEQNNSIRRWICSAACLNSRKSCSSLPMANAGSGTPQCAMIVWLGQIGHVSRALSQTVMTKSNCMCWYSSQDLLRAALSVYMIEFVQHSNSKWIHTTSRLCSCAVRLEAITADSSY